MSTTSNFFERLRVGKTPAPAKLVEAGTALVRAEIQDQEPTSSVGKPSGQVLHLQRQGSVVRHEVPDDLAEVPGEKIQLETTLLRYSASRSSYYLLCLESDFQSATVHTLRQRLGGKYQPLTLQPMDAESLARHRKGLDAGQAKQQGANQYGLNIARAFEIIEKAIKLDASDIHIDVKSEGRNAPFVSIRYRAQGVLTEPEILKTQQAVVDMTESIRGLFQDSSICVATTRVGGNTFDLPIVKKFEATLKPPIRNAELRFLAMPEKQGFFVVMRLISYEGKSAARPSLDALGLSPQQSLELLRASQAPNGLILVVGPTGAGKTTTVTTLLSLDPKAKYKRRISLEIPPESDIEWLSQIPTSEALLIEHANGSMRADPDVLSGGEIRNTATANMAVDYAVTGHLTFATFHGNGVFTSMSRMLGDVINIDRDILLTRGVLRAVFFQMLVNLLCLHCRRPAHDEMPADMLDLLKSKFELPTEQMYVKSGKLPDGSICPHCGGQGTKGRTAAMELMVPTREILKLLRSGDTDAAEQLYRSSRRAAFHEEDTTGKTAVEHAMYKVSKGLVCAYELFDLEVLWNYDVIPMESAS